MGSSLDVTYQVTNLQPVDEQMCQGRDGHIINQEDYEEERTYTCNRRGKRCSPIILPNSSDALDVYYDSLPKVEETEWLQPSDRRSINRSFAKALGAKPSFQSLWVTHPFLANIHITKQYQCQGDTITLTMTEKVIEMTRMEE